ncbi:hypothetical protein [Roseateles asaccharophilus]|uniref:Uncharacterized protein n=1 Tax=Roseateles asaccharophilus TaxID=582607 RepID=A0ABU2A9H2_9BURK|nr:hypothetical protein [Roseateles asaccharophilus]MDR7333842.1 hypothetical protein [Roseateles asaccharophilus]
MLQLTPDQLDQVEALQSRRDAASLLQLLGAAWPEVAQRLQDRWPAFVELALDCGQALGLRHAADLARYASLCCLWGARFETRAGFEWAAAIGADAALSPTLRLHQLTHRSREELGHRTAHTRQAGDALTPAGFDQALAAVEAGLAQAARGRSIFLDQPPPPRPTACDLAAVGFAVVEPKPLQAYQGQDGNWRRVDLAPWAPAPETLTAPPDEPRSLAVLSRASGAGASARLQLAVNALGDCGASHPEVRHDSGAGRLHWRGADTARLSLTLHAPPLDAQLPPAGIAHGEPPDVQTLNVGSCGIRDAGAPLGSIALELRVHAATQRLVQVRHGATPALAWPQEAAAPAAPSAPALTSCQLEADGQTLAVPTWLKAWQQLQPQARAGLEKLHNAWSRQMAGSSGRLEAELSPLLGQADISWGWQHEADGSVALRLLGGIDFAALVLDLRLAGELDWAGSRARVSLRAQGRSDWRMSLDQRGAQATEGQGLEHAKATWRLPFALSVEAIAIGEPALLSAGPLAPELRGAVVGECGLRPRPDGRGQQWFYKLAIEPVYVNLLRQDPLTGTQRQRRELLPALTLIDWSAG